VTFFHPHTMQWRTNHFFYRAFKPSITSEGYIPATHSVNIRICWARTPPAVLTSTQAHCLLDVPQLWVGCVFVRCFGNSIYKVLYFFLRLAAVPAASPTAGCAPLAPAGPLLLRFWRNSFIYTDYTKVKHMRFLILWRRMRVILLFSGGHLLHVP